MKITVLGCGSSPGVPLIGNNWGQCDPKNPRNRRLRVSVLVEDAGQSILIDTSPDMRQQMLDNAITNITAVLYTHAHADHCHGIDELRTVNWMMKRAIPVYADAGTMRELTTRFPYIFQGLAGDHYYKPSVTPNIIDGPFQVGEVKVIPFAQDHVHATSLGFRIGDFAYSTDVKRLDETAFDALRGIKTWVVDCVREEEHPTHAHLSQTLEWIARVKPEQAYLTHMNHMMDYDALCAKLPKGVLPAHDGLVINL